MKHKEYKYDKNWTRNEYFENKAVIGATLIQPVPIKNATIHGKQLYGQYNMDEIHGLNVFLSCATYLSNGNPCIITDTVYSEAPYNVKVFLAEHEIGHLLLNHVKPNMPTAKWYSSLKRLLPWTAERKYEYEADAHAAKAVGVDKGLETFNWILNTIQLDLMSRLEIKSRIRSLKKLS